MYFFFYTNEQFINKKFNGKNIKNTTQMGLFAKIKKKKKKRKKNCLIRFAQHAQAVAKKKCMQK